MKKAAEKKLEISRYIWLRKINHYVFHRKTKSHNKTRMPFNRGPPVDMHLVTGIRWFDLFAPVTLNLTR